MTSANDGVTVPWGVLRVGDLVRYGLWVCRVSHLWHDGDAVCITLHQVASVAWGKEWGGHDWRVSGSYRRQVVHLTDTRMLSRVSPELALDVAVFEAAHEGGT